MLKKNLNNNRLQQPQQHQHKQIPNNKTHNNFWKSG